MNLADSVNFAWRSGKTPTFIYNGTTYEFSPAGLLTFLTAESGTFDTGVFDTLDVDGGTLAVSNGAVFMADLPTADPGVDDQVWSDSGVITLSIGPLLVSTLSPLDDAVDVAIASDLVITFNRNVIAGTGNVELYDDTDTLVEAFDVTTDVTIVDDEVTINPTASLDNEASYYVLIDATAFVDAADIAYAGITDITAWSFTTVAA
jgi:hypothetical protein